MSGTLRKETTFSDHPSVKVAKIENNWRATCRVENIFETKRTSRAGSGVLVDGKSLLGFYHPCLLTNKHVIETADQAASSTIFFNYIANEPPTTWLKAALDPDRCFAAHENVKLGLDFCIVAFKIDSNLPRLSKPRTLYDVIDDDKKLPHCPAPVKLDHDAAIKKGDPVPIWQHPGGNFQARSLGAVMSVTPTKITYSNDTEEGSSGSPIYNDKADLVGIHYAGGTLSKR